MSLRYKVYASNEVICLVIASRPHRVFQVAANPADEKNRHQTLAKYGV
jgi:hypothetical protein